MTAKDEGIEGKKESKFPKRLSDQLKRIKSKKDLPQTDYPQYSSAEELAKLRGPMIETQPYQNGILSYLLEKAKSILELPEDLEILYPGSNADTSAADIFGKSHVLHLDTDQEAMAALSKAGYHTLIGRSEEYKPDIQYDAVIFWNSGATPDSILNLIKPNGYAISNNYHGAANILIEEKDFEIIGAINNGNKEFIQPEDARNLLGYHYVQIKVDRDGNTSLHKLTGEQYESVKDDPLVQKMDNSPDVMFIYRKKDTK